MPVPADITYGVLSQTHCEYNAELWWKLQLLYRGGFEFLEHADQFLHRAPNEPEERYRHRIQEASYICYFGQIVDYLAGALFHEKLQVLPSSGKEGADEIGALPDETFYREFAKDADRCGMPFSGLMGRAVTTALICRRAWIAVDLPDRDPEQQPTSRAAEDAMGLSRAYAFEYPPEEVLNWSRDDDGKLQWLVTRWRVVDRSSPFVRHTEYRDRFKVWFRGPGGEGARWFTFETAAHKIGGSDEPRDEEKLTLVDEGQSSFFEIPMVELELPYGLWAGNKIGPLALEHFRGRSDLRGSLSRSLVEIPYVKLGPEIPGVGEALPAARAQDPNRGDDPIAQYAAKGYMVLGDKDELGFAGPSGRGFEVSEGMLGNLREEMYRSVTAMALSLSNTAAAVGRSGESKREDRSATEIVLDALGELTRRAATRVYGVVSGGRGERVGWAAQGLSTFSVGASAELVEEAERVEPLNIPSVTFRKEYLTRLALALVPNAAPATKAQIQQELAIGVEDADELAALMRTRLSDDEGADAGRLDNTEVEPIEPEATQGAAR